MAILLFLKINIYILIPTKLIIKDNIIYKFLKKYKYIILNILANKIYGIIN